ncbi:MAG: hypothetical protein ACYC8T_12855 [Myxococcaceae bacterium]
MNGGFASGIKSCSAGGGSFRVAAEGKDPGHLGLMNKFVIAVGCGYRGPGTYQTDGVSGLTFEVTPSQDESTSVVEPQTSCWLCVEKNEREGTYFCKGLLAADGGGNRMDVAGTFGCP